MKQKSSNPSYAIGSHKEVGNKREKAIVYRGAASPPARAEHTRAPGEQTRQRFRSESSTSYKAGQPQACVATGKKAATKGRRETGRRRRMRRCPVRRPTCSLRSEIQNRSALPAPIPFPSLKSRIKNNPIQAFLVILRAAFGGVPSGARIEVAGLRQGARFISLCKASLLFGRDGDSEREPGIVQSDTDDSDPAPGKPHATQG